MTASKDKKPEKKKPGKKEELSYDQIAFALKSQVKQAPVKTEDQMTDKEKALARKKKLLELQEQEGKDAESEKKGIKERREEKLESKRDFAIAKMVKEHEDKDKQGKKAKAAQEQMALKMAKNAKKVKIDEDL